MGIGLFAIFIAGWPYGGPISRLLWVFQQPFHVVIHAGVSLFIAGMINLWHRYPIKIILTSLLIAFGIGLQFQISLDYRVDWNNHKRMIWQMTWRIPALTQHTAILGNYEPPMHYSDNSLSAELNSIYAPENKSDEMSYMYYFRNCVKKPIWRISNRNGRLRTIIWSRLFTETHRKSSPFIFIPVFVSAFWTPIWIPLIRSCLRMSVKPPVCPQQIGLKPFPKINPHIRINLFMVRNRIEEIGVMHLNVPI
jgi:hypothetical protein